MPYVEAPLENEAVFMVQTHKELANVSIPSVSGRRRSAIIWRRRCGAAVRGDAVGRVCGSGRSGDLVGHLVPQTRDLAAVKLSLDYLRRAPSAS